MAALELVACGGPKTGAENDPVRVFAASSLTDVLQGVGEAFVATGGSAPVFNFASSSDLARQIAQGADADIFISADEAWMNYLEERELVAAPQRRNILSNALVLIAPADHAIAVTLAPGADLLAALDGGTLAIANPDGVPAGRYAKDALSWLGAWDAVDGVSARAESVRAALRFVETGEAAAGIVYRTDALAAGDRVVVAGEFPAESHQAIVYPMAPVAGREAAAAAFADFLLSDAARTIFERAGFGLGLPDR